MSIARFDTLIWLFIFVGMLVFGIGLSASQLDEDLGFIVTTVGAVLALIGVVMIWLRSRMKGKR